MMMMTTMMVVTMMMMIMVMIVRSSRGCSARARRPRRRRRRRARAAVAGRRWAPTSRRRAGAIRRLAPHQRRPSLWKRRRAWRDPRKEQRSETQPSCVGAKGIHFNCNPPPALPIEQSTPGFANSRVRAPPHVHPRGLGSRPSSFRGLSCEFRSNVPLGGHGPP